MDIQTQRKMTKQKREFFALKTGMKWKQSLLQKDIPAIGAEESISLERERLKNHGLKALNDIYIIEEDPLEYVAESDSGLTPAVVDALRLKKLIIPDKFSSFAEKFPCTGTIISIGSKTNLSLKTGDRVGYARLGVQRYKYDGHTLCDVRERDLHYEIITRP